MLALSPEGQLRWHAEAQETGAADMPAALLRTLEKAFQESPAAGLLAVSAAPAAEGLPASLTWWRFFSQNYLTALCHVPRLREDGWQGGPPGPDGAALEALIAGAPPLPGMEYLHPAVLTELWEGLNAEIARRLAQQELTEILAGIHPSWRMVGRVTLHLAENKRSPEFPFAFLATYSQRLDARGAVQHLPLAQALRDSAAAGNNELLQTLLSPLHEASAVSPLLREMIESRRVFQPLAWTAEEAWQFLRQIPALEDSGLIVRVPNWWQGGRSASRPAVTVTVESGEPRKGMGTEGLLAFSVDVAMGGEKLTPEELARLLASEAPLISLKGQWVEIDRAKLRDALDKWQRAAAASAGGIPFHIGMRMLAGLGGVAGEAAEVTASGEWTKVEAGENFQKLLSQLRDPDQQMTDAIPVPGLRAVLRPYQRTGVNWMRFAGSLGLGACLADDMGLGKTMQVIALILLRRESRRTPSPTLLVVPASLLGNWRRELEKFAPDLEFLIAHRSATDAAALRKIEAGTHAALRRDAIIITTLGSPGTELEFAL